MGNMRLATASMPRPGSTIFLTLAVAALCVLSLIVAALSTAVAAKAQRPQRIVSINACTDQLLYALADPSQIAALTHYAVNNDYSIYPDEVRKSGVRLIRGSAEEVLKLKPDLVLAGTYTRRATRELLKMHGVKLALFPPAENVENAKAAIRQAAKLFHQEARGEALISEIDEAFRRNKNQDGEGPSVLQFQRRGFSSGTETLIGDLLQRLGARNVADGLGIRQVERITLETVLKTQPDALILFEPNADAADQGAALLRHPALDSLYPAGKQIIMPGRLTVCGGPALPMAIARLSEALRQAKHNIRSVQ